MTSPAAPAAALPCAFCPMSSCFTSLRTLIATISPLRPCRCRAISGFDDRVIGFGAGIFALGYIILEIPGTMIIERWSARRWIARIMVSWGIVTIGMAFIRTPHQFYTMRFLLGLAEAGFFPGIIVYLTHWFVYEDRAKAVAGFMAAIPLAYVVGSPVSGLLLGVHWGTLHGWQWLFILKVCPRCSSGS